MDEKSYFGNMQIYAQSIWHSEAKIAGDIDALTALRDTLTKVIGARENQSVLTFSSDGEGYEIKIEIASYEDLCRMPSHYTDSMANPDQMEREVTLQRRVFELEGALRKVKLFTGEKPE